MNSGYSGGYSNQSSMGGYGDYSECRLCFTHIQQFILEDTVQSETEVLNFT